MIVYQKGVCIVKNEEKKKTREYKIIINFNKITMTKICNKLNLNRKNICNGTAKIDDIKRVREELEKEIARVFLESDDTNERKEEHIQNVK